MKEEIMTTYEGNTTTETYTSLTPPTSTSTIQDFTQKQSSDEEQMTLIPVKNEELDHTNEIVAKYLQDRPLDPIYDACDSNPEFAIICSFISLFGDKIEVQIGIEQLKTSIENQVDKIDEELVEIHIKLLKKIRKYFVRDLWEKALVKFVAEYSYEDSCELDEVGYLRTRTSIKLQLLHRLLDAQFEHNQKFKESLNDCEAEQLRILPLGRDNRGNSYWKQIDNDGNFRMYQESPFDDKTWKTVFTKPEELNYLIEDLDKNVENRNKKCRSKKKIKQNDDEFFSCVEDDTSIEPVITRRARTARQSIPKVKVKVEEDEDEEIDSDVTIEEDEPCARCKKSHDPDLILLCDMCDDGYHTSCCVPPLTIIPDGDWFCPHCEHKTLLIKLKEFYASLIELLETREKERLKRERMSHARMKRVKKMNHLFIPREPRERRVATSKENDQASSATDIEDDEFENDDFSDTEVGNATSDESFKASSSSDQEDDEEEDEDLTETEEDDEDITDMDSFDSDATSIDELVAIARIKSKSKRKEKKKRTRMDRYESDDDYQPTRRAAATKKVSYKESSGSEDELIDHLFQSEDADMESHCQVQCDNVVQTIKEPEGLDISSSQLMPTIIRAQNLDLSTSPVHQPFYSDNDFDS